MQLARLALVASIAHPSQSLRIHALLACIKL
jgi:hypothetical protein